MKYVLLILLFVSSFAYPAEQTEKDIKIERYEHALEIILKDSKHFQKFASKIPWSTVKDISIYAIKQAQKRIDIIEGLENPVKGEK